jgi:hypothetical protein
MNLKAKLVEILDALNGWRRVRLVRLAVSPLRASISGPNPRIGECAAG